ncbi:MAG: DUF427 domain-containing protein [Candidatus Kariarchaeaceae archaeon]|jgi:uncharacterized protein (DUF427 family)
MDYDTHVNRWKRSPKPKNVITPGPGQESVWDYPRPPALHPSERVRIVHNGILHAESDNALKLMETASPPTYYIPREDIQMSYFSENSRTSYCEWKGMANYVDLVLEDTVVPSVGWTYLTPKSMFASLKGYIAFYASKFDECWVGERRAKPQSGDFYGGWITDNIVGPFKGEPGTTGW